MLATSWLQFKTATDTNSKVKARGTNMARVDDALQDYCTRIVGANPALEIALLQALVVACKDWLKIKKGKSDFQKNVIGQTTGYFNTLFVTRKVAITNLGNEALTELYNRLQHHGLLTTDLRGQIHFDKNKLSTLGATTNPLGNTGAFHMKPLKPMGNGYTNERLSYLQSGKTQAISGSGVHATHTYVTKLADKNETAKISTNGNSTKEINKLRQQAVKVARKDVHNLSMNDFKILDEIGKANLVSGNVDYLKKAERYKYMAIPDGAGSLRNYNDALITTHAYKVTAYAMDRYGNLMQKNADPIGANSMFFNHSSFNAGHDVICAGTLTIANGILQMIDNNSGHYRPTRQNLHNCLDVLSHEGVDLTHAIVNLYVWVLGAKQEHRYHATAFLANQNSAPFQIT